MLPIPTIQPVRVMYGFLVALLLLLALAAFAACTTDQLNIYRAAADMDLLSDLPPTTQPSSPGDPVTSLPDDPINPEGTTLTLMETLARFVPEPYRTIIAGGIGLLLAARNKRNGRIIAEAIQMAKVGKTVDFGNPMTIELLNEEMTRGARRMVDEAQGKTLINLPV